MKRRWFLFAGFLICAGLTACQGGSSTKGESYWKLARKAESFEAYLDENGAELDLEALRQEASSEEHSYSQRFKAAALLCAQEYQSARPADSKASWKDGAFDADYAQSEAYANQCLSQAAEGGEEFWASFDDAISPYDCFWPLFAAADKLDGQALAALWNGSPEDAAYRSKLEDVVKQWVKENPKAIVVAGDALMDAGFFEDWDSDEWRSTYFHNYSDADKIKTDSVQEALDYLSYVQKFLPDLEKDSSSIKAASDLSGEDYYTTKLMVVVDGDLDLKEGEGAEEEQPESIEVEGKKVLAFYQNLQTEEFADSPAPLRVIGDFMMGLPDGEFPASAEEADYYLVLTPNYEYGDFYQTRGGSETKIQEVYSSTSIDLYEASTGKLLRHIGNILENAPETIFTSYDEDSLQYPEVTEADVLSYMYHHINEPDTYVTLLDNIAGKSHLEKEESIILGKWEITYHSGEFTGSFTHGMFRYDPNEGCKFAKGSFTITNKSTEKEGFLPMLYRVGEDTIVELVNDSTEETYQCVDLLSYGKCLNGTYLEPGESKEGELYFQVPEDTNTENLFFAVSLGNQVVYYPY